MPENLVKPNRLRKSIEAKSSCDLVALPHYLGAKQCWEASSDKYRYGFNGKENDDEVFDGDRFQDYGMRLYRPDLGRFVSVDPLASEFPWWSPYQFAGNTPIQAIDLDGLETMNAPLTNGQNAARNNNLPTVFVNGKRSEVSKLDNVHHVLDAIAATDIPVIGMLADVGSAFISLYKGDYVGAGLSLAGVFLPGLSQLKFARNTVKLTGEAAKTFVKNVDDVDEYAELILNGVGGKNKIPITKRRGTGQLDEMGKHKKTDIQFDTDGFPDFSEYLHSGNSDVSIIPSGSRTTDAKRAFAESGITPDSDYVWHHHQDTGRMQYVRKDVHKDTGHCRRF